MRATCRSAGAISAPRKWCSVSGRAQSPAPTSATAKRISVPSKYYLVYFGKQTPTSWEFKLPKPPQDKGTPPADGMKFTAEVLDTWNMTVTPVESVFTIVKKTDYFHADKDGRSIKLPGRPYMAIRIKRVK